MVFGRAAQEVAYEQLKNGSLLEGAITSYKGGWGEFFWPVLFIFTLILIYIKTESPAFVAVFAILGNVVLYTLLPIYVHFIFYLTLTLSIVITLYTLFASSKKE